MVEKVTMYPTKVSQPNRNKDSGLQGKCLKAIRRNGTSYNVSCSYQKDPRYHHEWSNAEEILKGKTIQCGRPSTKFCSHKTYYGIKGYRNTCPIAGISGTYTQPATLRLFFDLKKKGVSSSAKIEKIEISFEHRCTGVDVANGKETTTWGPNFNGFDIYPNRKPLTIKIGSETKSLKNNPPLSSKFSSIGTLTFKNVSYEDLTKNGLDIIYGNNLETNPGNIYLRNFKATIYYSDGKPYITGTQDSNSLYISSADTCRTNISFTIDTGYKQGTKKMDVSKAPKNLRDDIQVTTPSNLITFTSKNDSKDKRKKIYTITDKTQEEGEKSIVFSLKNTKEKITLKYTAIKRPKPTITFPNQIERNTKDTNITSIVAKNGCAKKITIYDNSTATSPIYIFNDLNISTQGNLIKKEDIDNFYNVLSQLSCGPHKLFFKIDDEPNEEVQYHIVEIIPTQYKFKITEVDKNINLTSYETIQNKTQNKTLKLTYIKTKELIYPPEFVIENPTHGNNGVLIDNINWGDNSVESKKININGDSTNFTIGTYYPGDYQIKIRDKDSSCSAKAHVFNVKILPKHKQYFDEIFVRGEDSTSFNYDYLVAFEGDTITEPIFVETISLGASFNDIKICSQKEKIGRLGEINYLEFTVTNTSENDIQNLLLELNTIIKDEDDNYHVTSNEWLESDGIFYNFKENFEKANSDYNDFIKIKNLTADDDLVDEEDVYIHIEQIKAQESFDIKLPFSCSKEKEVDLQILLFGQPIKLYEKGYCSNETRTFDKIKFKVFDSLLTDMKIIGNEDLFSTKIYPNKPDCSCPNECFFTEEITYSIRNIDTISLLGRPETVIINDPRLVPYKFKYKVNGQEKTFNINEGYNEVKNNISFIINEEGFRHFPISGLRLDAYIKFENHKEEKTHQYTDANGETTLFVTIPSTVGQSFTTEELLKHMYIEYKGGAHYNGKRYLELDNIYDENTLSILPYVARKNNLKIIPIKNQIKYRAGQVVPIKVRVEGNDKYLRNEILFKPQIETPGTKDSITIFYKICNLEKNKGKVTTTFKTQDNDTREYIEYRLIPNQVSKTIYCGMDTDLTLYTNLSKVIVENKSLNRLYIALENKQRNNKNIEVNIGELKEIQKYDMFNYEVDRGNIVVENNNVKWKIDYMEENDIIRGYIDFRAEHIGYSILNTTVTDFITKKKEEDPTLKFGEDSYKCDCRKVN